MKATFSKIHVQLVFAVQNRNALILPSWEERLYEYISGIIRGKGQKMLAINGMPDHLHIFFGMRPNCRISDLVREIKKSSHDFISAEKLCKHSFSWQEGYGAFSYSCSHIDKVMKYIAHQKDHHKSIKFQDEYIDFLKKFQIDYDTKYLFDWLLDSYSDNDIG